MPWWIKFKPTEPNGISLVESIVAVAIIALISTSVLGLLWSSLRSADSNQARQVAIGIASEQIEIIKNLPYDEVGTVGGVPTGNLVQSQTTAVNSATYTIATDIHYIDDAFDNKAPTDTLNTDYKQVEIEVSWPNTDEPVTLSTVIAPSGIETTADGGTLWLEVYDYSTEPVTPVNKALITISAPTLIPPIALNVKSDSSGRYILPGTPAGTAAYQITVTKAGYGTDRTYSADPITNPNPAPGHLSIATGEITTEYMQISHLGESLSLHTTDTDTGLPLSLPFNIHSETVIGNDGNGNDIYEYDVAATTDSSGNFQLNSPEAGNYTLTFDEPTIGYVITGITRDIPIEVSPDNSESGTIYFGPYVPYSALFTIVDANNTRLSDVSVRLWQNPGIYDHTITTTSYGQAFFNDVTADSYSIEVSYPGYDTYLGSITILSNDEQTINLTQ